MFLRHNASRLHSFLPSYRNPVRRYATLFEGQPQQPSVQTALPGPQSIDGRARLGRVFDSAAMRMLVDYEQSRGN
jgi:hypothetical protein